jgi:hypothetical protein
MVARFPVGLACLEENGQTPTRRATIKVAPTDMKRLPILPGENTTIIIVASTP